MFYVSVFSWHCRVRMVCAVVLLHKYTVRGLDVAEGRYGTCFGIAENQLGVHNPHNCNAFATQTNVTAVGGGYEQGPKPLQLQ
ncbi:hypothetical protein [Bifidobacterium pseudolongum]|uniref:hypothetical protein n=1 Tax=Bifidobacterium pseudolongum TaxID=1694 RepID=UPI001022728F|nr:hypothetical protein [Bifidobacterium pseudolongum]